LLIIQFLLSENGSNNSYTKWDKKLWIGEPPVVLNYFKIIISIHRDHSWCDFFQNCWLLTSTERFSGKSKGIDAWRFVFSDFNLASI